MQRHRVPAPNMPKTKQYHSNMTRQQCPLSCLPDSVVLARFPQNPGLAFPVGLGADLLRLRTQSQLARFPKTRPCISLEGHFSGLLARRLPENPPDSPNSQPFVYRAPRFPQTSSLSNSSTNIFLELFRTVTPRLHVTELACLSQHTVLEYRFQHGIQKL